MPRELLAGMAALSLLLAGCMGGGGQTVTNNPGHFGYSSGGVQSGTQQYRWENPSTSAQVQFSGGGTGTVAVKIADAAGREVYSNAFGGTGGSTGGGPTSTGAPGSWTITLSISGAGGFTLNVDAR